MQARDVSHIPWFALLSGLLGVGCGSLPTMPRPRPSLIIPGDEFSAAGVLSPARWEYHPQGRPEFVAAKPLSSGGRLLLTADGERWLDLPGQAYATGALPAVEPLVASQDLGADGWLFVGASGTTYETQAALGPFLRSSAPPEALVRVTVSDGAIVGVDTRGRLLRSSDMGLSWSLSPVPGRVADVALLPRGDGLALLVPEQLFATSDAGETWQRLPHAAFGAVRLRATNSGLQVMSLLNSKTYTPGGEPPWREGVDRVVNPELNAAIPRRPSAEAVNSRRAIFHDGQYLEVRHFDDGWKLLGGSPAGSPLLVRALTLAKGCRDVLLSGRSNALYLACVEQRGIVAPLRLWRSENWGKTWTADQSELRGQFAQLQLVVLSDGSIVLSGICPPESSEMGCEPHGVFARSKPGQPLRSSSIPALRGLPKWLGTTRQGASVLALGTRTKSDALVAFSSTDGGRTFSATEVAGVEGFSSDFRAQTDLLEVLSAGLGDDDQVAIALRDERSGTRRLLVLDNQGQAVSLAQPPVPTAQIAGAGLYAIAHEPSTGEAWESMDGGTTWKSLARLRGRFCEKDARKCVPALACHSQGCVIGDALSRVGWRRQDGFDIGTLPPPGAALSTDVPDGFRSPYSCRFRQGSDWDYLRGRTLPAASQAGIGEVAWFTFDADWEDGSVQMHEAAWDAAGAVQTAVLLAPLEAGKKAALRASLQVEGVAALRIAGDRTEVAWRDLFQGRKTQRFVLPAGARVNSTRARSAVDVADPALLSIAPGGLFVRPDEGQVTYFTDGRTLSETPPLPRIDLPGRDEMVRADGQSVAIRLLGAGAGIVRSKWENGRWQQDAMAVGLLDAQPFALTQTFDIAYFGQRSGYHLMHLDGSDSRGWLFPFSAGDEPFLPPIAVPSQEHLGDSPKPCSAAQRAQTPRVVPPKQPGTSHRVVVSDSAEPIGTLETHDAVLYGAPEKPCVAFYEASSVRQSASEAYRALLSVDDRVSSWLFRIVPNASDFAYRPMDCRIDPALVVSDAPLGTE